MLGVRRFRFELAIFLPVTFLPALPRLRLQSTAFYMHIFVFEWVTGGGLLGMASLEGFPLLAKGRSMATAIAADFRASGAEVSMLSDPRVPGMQVEGCERIEVASPAEYNFKFDLLASEADAVFLIAPETDGILLSFARRCEILRANLISPSSEFVAITTNKWETTQRLSAAGVAVPKALKASADETLPAELNYPAVIKPIDGAGSVNTRRLDSAEDYTPPPAGQFVLEGYVTGQAASIGVLCGPAGMTPLPATWQRLSDDGQMRYLGGQLPLLPELHDRAATIALRALKALPPARGFIGIDLVLGEATDGSEDVVIEVNPRLSTSYVGLRAAIDENLAGLILQAANGQPTKMPPVARAIEFDADGQVRPIVT